MLATPKTPCAPYALIPDSKSKHLLLIGPSAPKRQSLAPHRTLSPQTTPQRVLDIVVMQEVLEDCRNSAYSPFAVAELAQAAVALDAAVARKRGAVEPSLNLLDVAVEREAKAGKGALGYVSWYILVRR